MKNYIGTYRNRFDEIYLYCAKESLYQFYYSHLFLMKALYIQHSTLHHHKVTTIHYILDIIMIHDCTENPYVYI